MIMPFALPFLGKFQQNLAKSICPVHLPAAFMRLYSTNLLL